MTPEAGGRKALFLDRDGTLNHLSWYDDSGEWESPRSAGELRLLDGALEALHAFQDSGWLLFVITNQPSFAKGKVSLESLEGVQAAMLESFQRDGIAIQKAYCCYHHPHGIVPGYSGPCPCRKPSPFFLLEAAGEFGLDLGRSWMIGDQDMDVACGRNAGCGSILIPYPHSAHKRGRQTPDLTLDCLAQVLPHLDRTSPALPSPTCPAQELP